MYPPPQVHHRVPLDQPFLKRRKRNRQLDRRARLRPARKRQLLVHHRQNPSRRRIDRQRRPIHVPESLDRGRTNDRIFSRRNIAICLPIRKRAGIEPFTHHPRPTRNPPHLHPNQLAMLSTHQPRRHRNLLIAPLRCPPATSRSAPHRSRYRNPAPARTNCLLAPNRIRNDPRVLPCRHCRPRLRRSFGISRATEPYNQPNCYQARKASPNCIHSVSSRSRQAAQGKVPLIHHSAQRTQP